MSDSPVRLAAPVTGAPRAADVAAVVVEATAELGATLMRYTATGESRGDVWYGSAEEAQMCAARDFGAALGAWRAVPADVADPVAFALADPPGSGEGRPS